MEPGEIPVQEVLGHPGALGRRQHGALVPLQRTFGAGEASSNSTTAVPAVNSHGRRITALARRYQEPLVVPLRALRPRRAPNSMRSAGTTSKALKAATKATTAPPRPMETKNRCGKIVRQAKAAATVVALKRTVSPVETSVARRASGIARPSCSSSRNSRHQEQGVIDRQPKPQAYDEVEGETESGNASLTNRSTRNVTSTLMPPVAEGQQRRQAPEDEQGQDGEQGEGQCFSQAEVGERLLACLVAGHVCPAEDHVVAPAQRRLDRLDHVVRVGGGLQRGRHHR